MNSITAFFALVAFVGLTHATDVIPNGSFESFYAGLPSGWTYAPDESSPTIIETSVVSPFQTIYAPSTHAVQLTANYSRPTLFTNFAATSGSQSFSFDFRLGSGTILASDYWFFEINGTGGTLALMRIGENGNLSIFDAAYPSSLSTPITRDLWYHLSFELGANHSQWTISLTPFAQSTQVWSDRVPMNIADIKGVYIRRNSYNGSIAPLYLDNFNIIPVPEPTISSYLLAFGIFTSAYIFGKALTRRCN